MPNRDSRRWSLGRIALLGLALAGGCAVYEVPTLAEAPGGAASGGNGFGGSSPGDGSGGSPAGQPASLTVDAGQGGASGRDGAVGGAGKGGTAGASGDAPAAADAGAAGSWGGESQGGNGGAAGAPDDDGPPVVTAPCPTGWRDQSTCDQCATQVQPDLRACAIILDCYVSKSCGPRSCGSTDQKCGPNVLGEGTAAYAIAQEVYTCMCE